MYDWNALWHTHHGYRAPYDGTHDDINDLAGELGARRVKTAGGPGDVAVYERDDAYLLFGHDHGTQLLTLPKHALYQIDVAFAADAPAGPRVEVRVDNPGTGEHETWHEAVRVDETGAIWLGSLSLAEGTMPPMPFDALSFTDNARFRDLLYSAWQRALPELAEQVRAWREGDAASPRAAARYQAMLRYEQAALARLFTGEERKTIAAALSGLDFSQPEACRGLWLAVERYWLTHPAPAGAEDLLEKLRRLGFAQELALVESL